MNKIEQQIKRIESLDINSLLDECINETEKQLLDLVKSQLESGRKGTGEALKDYESQSYADFKKNIVGSIAPYFTPDLKLTGDFYDGFFQQPALNGIEVYSKDWKASKLEKKYGNSIFNLTKENLEYYSTKIIYPILMQKIRKHLGY